MIDDDVELSSLLSEYLGKYGYRITTAHTVSEGRKQLRGREFDLLILDLMLPDGDGLTLCREIRHDRDIPIVMLTARGEVADRVVGLELGADDYLAKPFDFDELVARIRAQLRHGSQSQAAVLQAGDLNLDLKTRRAERGEKSADLTSREFALLEFLMRHQGQVLSRSQILGSVWGYSFDPQSNVVDVYVGYLRSKLDRPGEPTIIETIRGGGYRLKVQELPQAADTGET